MSSHLTTGPFEFLPITDQLVTLRQHVKIIGTRLQTAKRVARWLQRPPGLRENHGITTVINPFLWGDIHIAIAIEELLAISKMDLYSNGKKIEGHIGEFPTSNFSFEGVTESAYRSLTRRQGGNVLTYKIRWDLASFPPEENEFDLSLSSTLWFLITHWNRLREDKLLSNVRIACIGTRFTVTTVGTTTVQLVPIISFANLRLNIDYVSFERANVEYKLVGRVRK